MAETVKKSRIVSDNTADNGGNNNNKNNNNSNNNDKEDNFGDVLMEEFNLILKNCMSQDNLIKNDKPDDDDNDNIKNDDIIDDNNDKKQKLDEPYYDNIDIIKSNHINSSREFIKIEKENYYEEPLSVLSKNNDKKQNGHDHDHNDDDNNDNLYENIVINHHQQQQEQQHKIESDINEIDKTDKKMDQYVDMTQNIEISSSTTTIVENYEIINDIPNDIQKNIDNDKDDTLPEYEDIIDDDIDNDNQTNNIKIITVNDSNDNDEIINQIEVKSIKDRMLLSTDAQPCLFFTQTVTSPMLTPSEENIDFLKAFTPNENITGGGGGGGDDIRDEDRVTIDKIDDTTTQVKIDENVYENGEFLKYHQNEVIYENLLDRNVKIYENVDDLKQDQQQNQIVEISKNDDDNDNVKKFEKEAISIVNVITKSNIVENLKTQFNEQHITTIIINDNNNDNNNDNIINNNNRNQLKKDEIDGGTLKSVDIMKQISKFEGKSQESDDSQMTESYVEATYETTTTTASSSPTEKCLKKKKTKKSRKEEKENISVRTKSLTDIQLFNNNNNNNKLIDNVFNGVSVRELREKFYTKIGDNNAVITTIPKSSFNKFDALQKKNVLHIRSSDSSKAQEKFNGQISQIDNTNCRACDKAVFQMEQIKAEKSIWHRNCFRCKECNKQLNVDSYQSHEGTLYCKPHFKALFAPKAVEDDEQPKSRKPELIIRENQPVELPPDVVRASDKPDLGLEELQSLNVKERFQVFEQQQKQYNEMNEIERQQELKSPVNVKRSPSILSKLARFQAKGMDIGVADDSLNGIPIEESSDDDDNDNDNDQNNDFNDNDNDIDGNYDDVDLIRAKRVQKEKPFHFVGMSDVKNKWENVEQINQRDERREERKQEIQSIRNRLFMGKQGKMKEAYQQAVMESESCTNLKREQPIEVCDKTKSLKEKFEKGEILMDKTTTTKMKQNDNDDVEVFESEISKKSRSLFLELDANASKPPQIAPVSTPKLDVKRAREAYLSKTASSEDVVKSSIEQVDDVMPVRTADIQERFKFFETYKEPEKERKQFRITPPREGQVKVPTPDREIYRDPEIVRSEEHIEDSIIAKEQHTATKMLSKFRQMEENLTKEPDQPIGPKPLKCFTPPPEPIRQQQTNEDDDNDDDEDDEDDDEDDDDDDEDDEDRDEDKHKYQDDDLIEAQKAARAKQLRAKFERWEANEIKKEQANGINIAEEFGDEQSIESTRTLRARFESMRETTSTETNRPKVKVNRFVDIPNMIEICESCKARVYPLEKISIHERIYHKNCFKCMECNCVLRIDSYSYNQGLLYCMPHFKRLFISKGNYDSAFGLMQSNNNKEKMNGTSTTATGTTTTTIA